MCHFVPDFGAGTVLKLPSPGSWGPIPPPPPLLEEEGLELLLSTPPAAAGGPIDGPGLKERRKKQIISKNIYTHIFHVGASRKSQPNTALNQKHIKSQNHRADAYHYILVQIEQRPFLCVCSILNNGSICAPKKYIMA